MNEIKYVVTIGFYLLRTTLYFFYLLICPLTQLSYCIFSAYEVVVKEVEASDPVTRKRRASTIPSKELPTNLTEYTDGSKMYITAHIDKRKVPALFKVGDGKTYMHYYNQPLKPSWKYKIYTRAITYDANVRDSYFIFHFITFSTNIQSVLT